LEDDRVLLSNSTAVVIRDGFPVTEGHSLVIPRRHIESVFDLTEEEFQDLGELSSDVRRRLLESDDTIEGFNIGVNDGTVAGQTVPHCHVHIIPRRAGDVDNPRGGVRHVIPGMGDYTLTLISET
jgi:diadenosine tetraphosphate (Ap4A) HIT family hydrolase